MKAMSNTMEIIIAIVVILVAALVLLTIFGSQLADIAEQQCVSSLAGTCKTQCIAEGKTSGSPSNWNEIGKCTIDGQERTISCDCSAARSN